MPPHIKTICYNYTLNNHPHKENEMDRREAVVGGFVAAESAFLQWRRMQKRVV